MGCIFYIKRRNHLTKKNSKKYASVSISTMIPLSFVKNYKRRILKDMTFLM